MAGLIGTTIGNYELVERLGRGAMAAVYKAHQKSLNRFVAVKILHPEVANDETFVARFQLEARSVASLRHPNIVRVHDFGTEGGVSFLVMEYIEGPSLKERLKTLRDTEQRMPFDEVLRVTQNVASALDHAHTCNIIHRDVKPGNIMLTAAQEGNAILTDFGLTRILGMSSLTSSGILGTPEYLAPEQGEDGPVDARSDLYSLGIVLYEMLTGRTPFEGEMPLNMILKHIQGDLPSPCTFNPGLPAEIEQAVLKTLARAPDARFQHANDMIDALTQALSPHVDTPVQAPAPLSATVPQRPTPTTFPRTHQQGHIQLIDREELRRAVSTSPDSMDQILTRPAPELHLLVTHGLQQGQSIPLAGQVTLGRAPNSTFVLTDARISRRHATIQINSDRIQLTDLGSTNGTFVNQQRISTTLLHEGDLIQIGDVTLVVQRRNA